MAWHSMPHRGPWNPSSRDRVQLQAIAVAQFAGLHQFNEQKRTLLESPPNFRYLSTLRKSNLPSAHKTKGNLAFGAKDHSNPDSSAEIPFRPCAKTYLITFLRRRRLNSKPSMGEVQPKQSSSLLIARPESQKSASLKEGWKHKGCLLRCFEQRPPSWMILTADSNTSPQQSPAT